MRNSSNLLYKLLVIVVIAQAANVYPQGAQLIWTATSYAGVKEYGIYRSIHSDSTFTLVGTVSHPDTVYIDDAIDWNAHYFYAVTTIDQAGLESNFSNIAEIYTPLPTPVELVSFSARVEDTEAVLKWSTASETNNSGFEVQRSTGRGTGFVAIAFVGGHNNSSTPRDYEFVDKNLATGRYYYRLRQIDFDGESVLSAVVDVSVGIPDRFYLRQNYPNPFNPSTTISFSLPRSTHVNITIYNDSGQEVYELVDKSLQAGQHSVEWRGINNAGERVASGTYYYKMVTARSSLLRRMTYLR